MGRPVKSPSLAPNRSNAARFGRNTVPSASRPITPEETPNKTVSVNRRRSSSWRLALISSARWFSSWLVILLNARLREPISSPSGPSVTRAVRSPSRTFSVATTRLAISFTSLFAKIKPTQMAAKSSKRATIR